MLSALGDYGTLRSVACWVLQLEMRQQVFDTGIRRVGAAATLISVAENI